MTTTVNTLMPCTDPSSHQEDTQRTCLSPANNQVWCLFCAACSAASANLFLPRTSHFDDFGLQRCLPVVVAAVPPHIQLPVQLKKL